MAKAVGYSRVSTGKQLDGFSISTQHDMIQDFCKSKGLTLSKIYDEGAGSAKSIENRDVFKEMIYDVIENNKNQKVYVVLAKLDRFSRNTVDGIHVADLLKSHGHCLVSIVDGFDSDNPYAKTLLINKFAQSEQERENIVLNVRNGMKKRAQQGLFNGGKVFGYNSTLSKELEVNKEQAKVVQFIFDRYTNDDWGYKKIAHFLNTQYTEAKAQREWDVISIKTIVTNPIYAGFIRWGEKNDERKIYIGKHQAIISNAQWEKAKQIFEAKSYQPIKIHKGSYFLSGLLRCPDCGSSMVQHKSKGGKYLYYQCSKNKTKGLCKSNLVNKEKAEAKVLNELSSKLQSPDYENLLSEKIKQQIKLEQIPVKKQYSMIEQEERELQNKIDELFDLFTSHTIPKETLQDQVSRYENMKNELKTRKENIEAKLHLSSSQNTTFIVQQVLNNFESFFYSLGDTEKKGLLREIISDIQIEEVDTGGKRKKRQISEIHYYFDENILMEIAS
ncbi:recombinase family protein [Heyndrickxia sp. FSL W8-0423]|uniref:recombinase family protein n=1 Tax=Heyndrickxia sp. FSL W8-0423 TaxID=2921601 RepID=UPI0030FC74C6